MATAAGRFVVGWCRASVALLRDPSCGFGFGSFGGFQRFTVQPFLPFDLRLGAVVFYLLGLVSQAAPGAFCPQGAVAHVVERGLLGLYRGFVSAGVVECECLGDGSSPVRVKWSARLPPPNGSGRHTEARISPQPKG